MMVDHITPLITSLGQYVAGDVGNLNHVLRRLRLLWQLVLGIEDGAASCEYLYVNNTSFLLVANSKELGDAAVSSAQVDLLDSQIGSNDDASLYIGVLNKVRKVVYQHADVANDVGFREFVSKLLIEELERLLDGAEGSVDLDCQDKIFVDCYNRASNMFLLAFDESDSKHDIMNLLSTTSDSVARSYLKRRNLVRVIETERLVRYQQDIIDVMKYAFRKHPGYHHSLDVFFSENPIFCVLSQTNESTTTVMGKLDLSMVINLLTQMCRAEKEKNQDIPITMEYLPQILKYYTKSLEEEGEVDVENDFYIKMIKSITLKWIDEKIDTQDYSKQLIDISLVPSAMPYVYHGVKLPNVHMRRALYDLKEEIRLKDVYFNGWLQCSTGLPAFLELEAQWNQKKMGNCWDLMVDKFNSIQEMKIRSDKIYDESLICKSFSVWIGRMVSLKEAEEKFKKYYLQKSWSLWKSKESKLKMLEHMHPRSLKVAQMRTYFNVWRIAKERQHHGQQAMFLLSQKRRFFTSWKLRLAHQKAANEKSLKIYNANLIKRMMNLWKQKAHNSLSKIGALSHMEKEFHTRKSFTTWMKRAELEKLYRMAIVKRDEIMLRWCFCYYLKITRLRIQVSEAEAGAHVLILNRTFNHWKLQHELNQNADLCFASKLLGNTLKAWKLRYRENRFAIEKDKLVLSHHFKTWQLEKLCSKAISNKSEVLKRQVLRLWQSKVNNQQALIKRSDEVREMSLKKLYYAIWRSYRTALGELKLQEVEFEMRSRVPMAQLKHAMTLWMLNTVKIQIKHGEIEKRERMFNSKRCDKYMLVWRKKTSTIKKNEQLAVNQYSKKVLTETFEKWLNRIGVLYDRYDEILAKRDDDDVNRAKHILSKWSMKMIKIKNDENKCNEFLNRWQNQRKLVFWEIWRMKPKMRQMELNPFNDLSTLSTPTPLEKRSVVTPRRSPIRQRSETSLLQSVERVRRRELAERIERYKFR